MNEKNNSIVGWGLAGATLAWQFYFNKTPFLVFDSGINTCTKTAAGIVNPIVFKRLTLSWRADELMSHAKLFYNKVEKELGVKIIEPKSIYKMHTSHEDVNNWAGKQNLPHFKQFLGNTEQIKHPYIKAPFGLGKVNTFGNLNTEMFLTQSKQFFLTLGVEFNTTRLNYSDINIKNSAIIFCEGAEIKNNPFFNYLPLKPTHGETITIKTDEYDFNDILNKNMFIMPLGNNLYQVGATYNWEKTNSDTTEIGKNELIEKLKNLVDFKYQIVDHQAGIRPTVLDRKPLLGKHPNHENLYVFNGLGTKGVMLAPFFSNQLLNFINNTGEIDNEVDILRFQKYLN